MNIRFFVLVILIFTFPSLLLRAAPISPQQAQAPPGTLRGVVTREGGSEPIPGVRIIVQRGVVDQSELDLLLSMSNALLRLDVQVQGNLDIRELFQQGGNADSERNLNTVTDAEGRFVLEGIPAGQYTIIAQRTGFFGPVALTPESIDAPAAALTRTNVVSRQTADVRLNLVPGAAVSGRVQGSNGGAASNITVEVLKVGYENGVRTFETAGQKRSDDRGEYRLFQLPPGDYYLAATMRLGGAEGNPPPAPEVYVPTYYPNSSSVKGAVAITLHPGDELTGMNIQLQSAVNYKVSGRVISLLPANAPSPQISGLSKQQSEQFSQAILHLKSRNDAASLDSRFGANGGVSVSMTTPNNGAFEIKNVPPGEYDLYASLDDPAGYVSSTAPATAKIAYGRTAIDVRSSDLDSVTVSVHSGVDVHGGVVVDGKPASAPLRLSLQPLGSAVGLAVLNFIGREPSTKINIQQDGSFTIPSVPESAYRLAVQMLLPLSATAYIADIRQHATSIYDDGFVIGTSAVSPIEVVIKTNGGAVQGTVVGPNEQPFTAGALVALIPQPSRRQNPALYRTAVSGSQGEFKLSAVPPGSYKIFAW